MYSFQLLLVLTFLTVVDITIFKFRDNSQLLSYIYLVYAWYKYASTACNMQGISDWLLVDFDKNIISHISSDICYPCI